MARRSLSLRNLLSSAGDFFRWWGRELLELLPRPLRRHLFPRRALLLRFSDGTLAIWRLEEDELTHLATLNEKELLSWRRRIPPELHRWPCEVVLSPRDGLLTRVKLPAVAAENLRQVLAFELDQYTPWTAEQAEFDFRLLRHAGAKLEVELVAVPKTKLKTLLDFLEALDLRPRRIDMARSLGEPGERLGVNLLSERTPASSAFPLALAGALILGTLAALAMPVVMREQVKRELRAQIETLLPEADRTVRIKRRVLEELDRLGRLEEALARQPPMVLLLEDLAQKLPHHTHVTSLRYRRREETLYVAGLSERASELIARLEASPYLEALQFTTAITRDARGRERFQLQGKVVSPQ